MFLSNLTKMFSPHIREKTREKKGTQNGTTFWTMMPFCATFNWGITYFVVLFFFFYIEKYYVYNILTTNSKRYF